MTICIENLKFQAVVGILDFERTTPQDVLVDAKIVYTYGDTFINYAEVASLIKENMIASKFFLIEDALAALSQILREKFTQIETLQLKITKPSILPDCSVSVSENYLFSKERER